MLVIDDFIQEYTRTIGHSIIRNFLAQEDARIKEETRILTIEKAQLEAIDREEYLIEVFPELYH